MSLKIRLARAGTKKRPFYHVVVADSRSPRDGRFIERIGHFNPLLRRSKTERLKLDLDKVKAWLAKGALPTDRVLRFLDEAGVMKRPARNNPQKAIPRKERKARAEGAPRPRPAAAAAAQPSAGPPCCGAAASSDRSRGGPCLRCADRRRARRPRRGPPARFTGTPMAVARYGPLETRGRLAAASKSKQCAATRTTSCACAASHDRDAAEASAQPQALRRARQAAGQRRMRKPSTTPI